MNLQHDGLILNETIVADEDTFLCFISYIICLSICNLSVIKLPSCIILQTFRRPLPSYLETNYSVSNRK